MACPDRAAEPIDPSPTDGRAEAELLGCGLSVAGIAQVAGVVIDILAAQSERYGVVDHISGTGDAALEAPFA